MSLNSQIADLLVEKGRAQAQGAAASGQAYGNALTNIGQGLGQAITGIPKQQEEAKLSADRQRARDAQRSLSDAMRDVQPIEQDGLKLYNVAGMGDFMSSKGYGAEFVPAAQHLDAVNQSLIGFQQARLSVLQAGAKGLLAADAPAPLVDDFLDRLERNQVYAPTTIKAYKDHLRDNPDAAKAILQSIAGPQKLEKVGPDESLVNPLDPTKPVFTGPSKPIVVNGQLVNPKDAAPIGAPIPKQATPLTDEEKALKVGQLAEITAKLEGKTPISVKDRAELQLQRDRLNAEVAHWKNQDAAANPLAALAGSARGGPAMLTGDDFLKTLPSQVASEVKAYAEGRRPFPAGFALKSPYFQSMIQMVGQYDPTFDALNYGSRSKTRNAFTSGKEAAQVNALNTVLGHLDKLSDAAEALNNGSVPMLNSITNALSKSIGRPNVTNFETIKKAVADEVTKVWRQAGGSVEDVRTAQENLKASNSPDQLRGAIATYGELLQSKLGSLEDQYKQGMGTAAVSLLRPESAAVLEKISKRATGAEAPKQSQSLTIDQVKKMAELAGTSYEEAKKHAESKGYIVR